MLSSQKIRYLILASLLISLPAQPVGWFDSTWKKVGVGIAAVAALAGLIYGFKRYNNSRKPKTLRELLNLPAHTPIDKNNPAFIKQVNDRLLEAATHGHVEHIDLLVKSGADINIKKQSNLPRTLFPTITYETTPAVIIAAENGHVAATEKLLKLGARITQESDTEKDEYLVSNSECRKLLENQQTIIAQYIQAATNLSDDPARLIVHYLSPRIISFDTRMKNVSTYLPLLSAARDGDIERVKRCLDENNPESINIDAQDECGRTALLVAIRSNQPAIAQFLIQQGANVNIGADKDGLGKAPLSVEISRIIYNERDGHIANSPKIELLALLLDKRADVSHKSKDGRHAYDFAQNHKEICTLLQQHRRSMYYANKDAIAKKILSLPEKEIAKLPYNLILIIGTYAAEYPLMKERPMLVARYPEIYQVQEIETKEEAAAQQTNSLSLDA